MGSRSLNPAPQLKSVIRSSKPDLSERLEGKDLDGVLRQLDGGSMDAAIALAADAITHRLDDEVLLRERRDLILQNEEVCRSVEVMGLLCLMSAHIGDIKFCDFWLPNVKNPYFDYMAYKAVSQREGKQDAAQRYLCQAARAGYLLAVREVFERKHRDRGLLGRTLVLLNRLRLGVAATFYIIKNKNDKRLPRV